MTVNSIFRSPWCGAVAGTWVCLCLNQWAAAQAPAPAEPAPQPKVTVGTGAEQIFTGKILKITGHQLTVVIGENEQQRFTVAADAQLQLNGKPAKLADLSVEDKVKISTFAIKPREAVRIVAARVDPNANPREVIVGSVNEPTRVRPGAASAGVLVDATPFQGVIVVDVDPAGPAAKAGLQKGDYILSVKGVEKFPNMIGAQDFANLIDGARPGQDLYLGYWRGGERLGTVLTLGTAPPSESAEQSAARPPGGRVGMRPGSRPGQWILELPSAEAVIRTGDTLEFVVGGEAPVPESERTTEPVPRPFVPGDKPQHGMSDLRVMVRELLREVRALRSEVEALKAKPEPSPEPE